MLESWNEYERQVSNKENHLRRPRRFIDEQPNATKAQWLSQDSFESQQNVARPSKRKQSPVEADDESDSHDEGFQADRRKPDLNRRIAAQRASPNRLASAAPQKRSRKRARVQESEPAALQDDQDEQADEQDERPAHANQARQKQQRSQPQLPADVKPWPAQYVSGEGDEEEEAPRPTATQVAAAARTTSSNVRRRGAQTQTRTPWSEADSELLIDLIGEIGCSWREIAAAGEGRFGVDRGQVGLKDKARNLKVQFLT